MNSILKYAILADLLDENLEEAALLTLLLDSDSDSDSDTDSDSDDDDESLEDIEDEAISALLSRERRVRTSYPRLDINSLTGTEIWTRFKFRLEDLQSLSHHLNLPAEIECKSHFKIASFEGLLILIRRLCYPNRLKDLEREFGRSQSAISEIFNSMANLIIASHGHLLKDLGTLRWLDLQKLRQYSQTVFSKGAPLKNCWGFMETTTRPICKPSRNEQLFYNTLTKTYCVKYQGICTPDGIIVSLLGPHQGRRHNAGIFGESKIDQQLSYNTVFGNENFVVYGERTYPISKHVYRPYWHNVSSAQEIFNETMSDVKKGIEWGFGNVLRDFEFVELKKNQKLLLQNISDIYHVAVLLSNCRSCLYGNECAEYFNIQPITLKEYLEN